MNNLGGKIVKCIKNPEKIILLFLRTPLSKILPDKIYLKYIYRFLMGRKLDLNSPQTFNEKLQWLKLHDRKPIYTTMVDKYEAKKYVADIIGEEYIIPTIGVWDKFDDIDFDSLPDQFVLKCTHDSGGLVIVKDKSKLDKDAARAKIEKSLKTNFFWMGREWPYKNVKPRIIAEKYMIDNETGELRDYKFFCFNGKVKLILVCTERFSSTGLCEDFFDIKWHCLELKRPNHPNCDRTLKKPQNLRNMIHFSEMISKNISFIRVDFYEVNEQLFWGENTFYPASGFETFEPIEWDIKLGQYIELPFNRKGNDISEYKQSN